MPDPSLQDRREAARRRLEAAVARREHRARIRQTWTVVAVAALATVFFAVIYVVSQLAG